MSDQTVIEFEPTALQANTFTREGYIFDGWNTEADGTTYTASFSMVKMND